MANRLTENKNRDASFPASEKAFEDVEYEKSEEDRQQQVGQRGTKHRRHLLFLKRFFENPLAGLNCIANASRFP